MSGGGAAEELLIRAREVAPALERGLAEVQASIADAATRAGRDPADVTLVAVTKGRPPEMPLALIAAGIVDVGENRVAEGALKAEALERVLAAAPGEGWAAPRWHLVGHLQRNKVGAALGFVDMLHSLDSLDLARALVGRGRAGASTATAGAGEGGRPALPAVLVEVNVAGEHSKYGIAPGDAPEFIDGLLGLGLAPSGLMCMAPQGAAGARARSVFARLAELRDALDAAFPEVELRELSMGMSDDFADAIAEGATMVRIGRAIFSYVE